MTNDVQYLVPKMLNELSSLINKHKADFLYRRAKRARWSTKNTALQKYRDSISKMPSWILTNTDVSELRRNHEQAEKND